jgi:hypothetical protein
MRITARLSVLAIAASAVSASRVAAQEDSNSGFYVGDCIRDIATGCAGTGSHILYDNGTNAGIGVSDHNDGETCYICYAGDTPVSALQCHLCNGHFTTTEAREAYAAILRAGSHGDVSTVARLAQKLPGYVEFNAARMAVQIRSCGKASVVASLPIRTGPERRVAAALPRTQVPSVVYLAAR